MYSNQSSSGGIVPAGANQSTAIVNRQIMQQQQQQPSISPSPLYNNSGTGQQPRAISTIAQNNMPQVSPHPTPTGTPNPFNDSSDVSGNWQQQNNQSNTSQGQTTQQQQQNSQFQNPMISNRINTPINVGSPVTNTSSPSPSLPPNNQQNPYFNNQPQRMQGNVVAGQQQQPNQPGQPPQSQKDLFESLFNRFKQATSTAERSQVLQEIRIHAPSLYQRIISSQQQQQQHQMQQQQMNQGTAGSNQSNQQWSGYNPQQQPQYANQQQQQIRYANSNTNLQQQLLNNQPLQRAQGQPIVLQPHQQPNQMGAPNMVQQNNPQMLHQQRLMQQQQQPGMQQRIMQQQPGMQQNMRPAMQNNVQQNNVYIQNQQHQQQQMMSQQQQHYQQDPQMMNQTKDQMLLQAPNKLHMPPGAQNQNQQINATDKLKQVVDDL